MGFVMDNYIFSSHVQDRELARLHLIEKALDPQTISLCERHVTKAQRCLEVGAGAGSIAKWLAGRVGREGLVVALDRDTRYLSNLPQPPCVISNLELSQFGIDQPFDFIHARYVLIHNTHGRALLKHMHSLLKPGGVLVVEEPDFTCAQWLNAYSQQSAERVNDAISSMFRRRDLDPSFGTQLPKMVKELGLETVQMQGNLHLAEGGSAMAQMMAASTAALRKEYLATGLVDDKDVDRYISAAEDSDSIAVYYATYSVVAQRKKDVSD